MRSLFDALLNKAPVPYTLPTRYGVNWGQRSNATMQMRAMENDGTLFAIVAKTSEALAGVDWKLYRKRDNADANAKRVEVTRHIALQTWNKPNQFMSRQRLVETFAQHFYLTGEAWLLGSRDGRAGKLGPTELWPVRPDKMRPVEHPTEFISGYEYTGPQGETVPLSGDDVIFIVRPNPLDPYRGMGPVQSVMSHIDSSRYSAEWNRNFFLNSAEPGGIIQVDGTLGDTAFQRLTSQWNEQHRGMSAAHRVAVLESGTTWVERKYTQRDMQFAEMSSVSDEKIMKAFAFPKFMLGMVEDVNRSNAEASEYIFAKWTLVSALERIKGALNESFLPMYGANGEGVEFDYCSPVTEDQEAANAALKVKVDAAVALVGAGFQADSALKAVGLPPIAFSAVTTQVPAAPKEVAA